MLRLIQPNAGFHFCLPETWTKAENLLNLDLDIFVRFGHSMWTARHGSVKSQETGAKLKASVKCDAT